MSDFDFDEIDKAVTGALGSDSSPSQEGRTEPASSSAAAASVRPDPQPTRTEQAAPAARRSAGRFMDVVHPSSDMRTVSPRFTPPPVGTQTPPASSTPVLESSSEPAPTSLAESDADWAQPLESPFLPDAKVEKRPLGGFSLGGSNTAAEENGNDEELLLEAPDEPRLEATTMPDPIDFAAHSSALPSESEDTGVTTQSSTESAPESMSPSYVEKPEEKEVQSAPVRVSTPTPGTPASIPQQYTEQPSSAPASGAIYDTETYHQPLAVSPKKTHGLWVGLWIFVLVVLGAGAGVAFYLFVLPML